MILNMTFAMELQEEQNFIPSAMPIHNIEIYVMDQTDVISAICALANLIEIFLLF